MSGTLATPEQVQLRRYIAAWRLLMIPLITAHRRSRTFCPEHFPLLPQATKERLVFTTLALNRRFSNPENSNNNLRVAVMHVLRFVPAPLPEEEDTHLVPEPSAFSTPGRKRPRDDDGNSVNRSPLVSFASDLADATPSDALPATTSSGKHFFLWPPVTEAKMFVRLITSAKVTAALGGEELNRYFARYGFIRCESLTHLTNPVNRSTLSVSGFAFQDFMVELDAIHNVESAMSELQHPEVCFLAYYSSEGKNTHSADDLPSLDEALESTLGGLMLSTPAATNAASHNQLADDLKEAMDTAGRSPSEYVTPVRQRTMNLGLSSSQTIVSQLVAYHRQRTQAGGGGETALAIDEFVPEIVVDNIPWWVTSEQLHEYCSSFGRVASIRMSTSDRCGVFLGCAAVKMLSIAEASKLCEGLNGAEVQGAYLVCGVCDDQLNLVSLADPSKIYRDSSTEGAAAASGCEVKVSDDEFLKQRRVWL